MIQPKKNPPSKLLITGQGCKMNNFKNWGKVFCPILEFREENRTFAKVDRCNVNFFFPWNDTSEFWATKRSVQIDKKQPMIVSSLMGLTTLTWHLTAASLP